MYSLFTFLVMFIHIFIFSMYDKEYFFDFKNTFYKYFRVVTMMMSLSLMKNKIIIGYPYPSYKSMIERMKLLI